jgi:Tfp pilus assembly protein PilN
VTGITLQGATYAQSGVARLLSRLSVAPVLTNVRLQSSTLAESGSAKLVQFTILADVRTAGGAS